MKPKFQLGDKIYIEAEVCLIQISTLGVNYNIKVKGKTLISGLKEERLIEIKENK